MNQTIFVGNLVSSDLSSLSSYLTFPFGNLFGSDRGNYQIPFLADDYLALGVVLKPENSMIQGSALPTPAERAFEWKANLLIEINYPPHSTLANAYLITIIRNTSVLEKITSEARWFSSEAVITF